jgi:aminomethyltransferase
MPLYGHDLKPDVSPVEAGLPFVVAKRRRATADFPGAARILRELEAGPGRVRVALTIEGAPAREGADIAGPSGAVVGQVTSGGFSPTLSAPIAIGFVPPALAAEGTALQVIVRGRAQPARVVALPFVPNRYVRKPPTRT